MKTEEFNKYVDWITKNNYKPIFEFIPPEFLENLFLIMEDFAKQEAIEFENGLKIILLRIGTSLKI